jgi:hypothetical protein
MSRNLSRSAAGWCAALLCCAPAALQAQPTVTPPAFGKAVGVSVDVSINKLFDVDTKSETFKLDGYLRARWKDRRLRFRPAAGEACQRLYEGPAASRVLGETVWWPAFELINVVGTSTVPYHRVYVDCDGSVEYYERFVGVFSSEMNLKRFPFDRQTLSIQIESYPYDQGDMTFSKARLHHSRLDEDELFEWKILDSGAAIVRQEYPYRSDGKRMITFSRCVFSITMKRKSRYYVLHFLAPLGLILCSSWVLFWMPDFSSRMSTALKLLLTLVAFSFTASYLLPRLSYETFIDLAILSGHLVIFLEICLVCLAHVADLRGHGALGERVIAHCRWCFPVANLIGAALLARGTLGG